MSSLDPRRERWLAMAAAAIVATLIGSSIAPYDRVTWALEVAPVVIALPILALTYRRYPLSTLLYSALFVHALVLIAGGLYTYARVPLGAYVADWFQWQRNPYDKLGHFMQGFVPALAAREILIRGEYVRGAPMLGFVVICIALAISATYELIEWGAAVTLGQGADEFLGTQGDPWDTQSDMLCALVGAITALLLLTRIHNRQIARVAGDHR